MKRILKHESTPIYFHLVRQLAKCMMRFDQLNRHDHGSYAEETAPSLNVNVTEEDESKEIIVHKTLSENSSTDVGKSERNIVNGHDHNSYTEITVPSLNVNVTEEVKGVRLLTVRLL